ncbi:uncharacterized protein VTP21DRAFT_4434 [Calcarisporiella thermophila]|uniref:uncharacterized protein n=1 Tax=Calcarisporiella thermophila TaxID=911321 RepID=UPI00374321A8
MRNYSSFCAFYASLLFFLLFHSVHALYFYLEGTEIKCFYEDLPKDTMVVGKYKIEDWSEAQKSFVSNPEIGVEINVEETRGKHNVLALKAASEGKFTFTTAGTGEHSLCFASNRTSWWNNNRMRFHLNFNVERQTFSEEFDHKQQLNDFVARLQELRDRVEDIRREQAYQREREIVFRDLSERTNERVVWWSMLQVLAIAGVCWLQTLLHVRFFTTKKII